MSEHVTTPLLLADVNQRPRCLQLALNGPFWAMWSGLRGAGSCGGCWGVEWEEELPPLPAMGAGDEDMGPRGGAPSPPNPSPGLHSRETSLSLSFLWHKIELTMPAHPPPQGTVERRTLETM